MTPARQAFDDDCDAAAAGDVVTTNVGGCACWWAS